MGETAGRPNGETLSPGGPAPAASVGVLPLSVHESDAFARLQVQWANLGSLALDWATRRVPGVPGLGADPEEYFATGEQEIDGVAARARGHGLPFAGGSVLDFGCGPGRMAQALAGRFTSVTGADVSAEMIKLAGTVNRHGDRCRFVHSPYPDLRLFNDGSFDVTFSVYVLQHMPPWLMRRYLSEFIRVTRPGGQIVFQLHGALDWRLANLFPESIVSYLHNRPLRSRAARPGQPRAWDVHWMRPARVAAHLSDHGATVRAIDRIPRPDGHMIGFWYFATRPPV